MNGMISAPTVLTILNPSTTDIQTVVRMDTIVEAVDRAGAEALVVISVNKAMMEALIKVSVVWLT